MFGMIVGGVGVWGIFVVGKCSGAGEQAVTVVTVNRSERKEYDGNILFIKILFSEY